MRRNSESFRNSGAYTSPGTPEYGDNNAGEIPKGWCSERVPLPTSSGSRRHISAAALMPFNSGRALPSKWDDAERWITSPISGYGTFKTSVAPAQRRPKSKSGPLGAPGIGYLSNYSPTGPVLEGGRNVRNFMGNSPLTTGVLVPDGLSIHYDGVKSNSFYGDNNMSRSTSVPGLSDLISEASCPSSQDDKFDGTKEEEETLVSRAVSRRDMATQMSPEGSPNSSPKERLSFSTLPSSIPNPIRPHANAEAKDEVRDVQVDKGTPTAKQSRKQGGGLKKLKDKANAQGLPSLWNIAEAKNASRLQREEAKITAWENLQKAKAEAAIRKLEMKLEKKRSESTDKILNKLKAAQMKAEARRNLLVSENHSRQNSHRTSHRRGISGCIYFNISPLSNCFPCHR